MPLYYTPGVYIEEVNKGPRPIEAVATAVAAFIGFAPAGPIGTPTLITSWTQFVETFGLRDQKTMRKDPYMKDAFLPHAVYGFFLNGGTRCYVVRVLPATAPRDLVAEPLKISTAKARAAKTEQPMLEIKPKKTEAAADQSTPTPAADLQISIERAAGSDPKQRLWTIRLAMGEVREEFPRVTLGSAAASSSSSPPSNPENNDPSASSPSNPGSGNPSASAPGGSKRTTASSSSSGANPSGGGHKTLDDVNRESKLITIKLIDQALATEEPALGVYYIDVPQPETKLLARTEPQDIIGDPIEHTGVVGLELADDVTMVCCPDIMSPLAYTDGKVDPTKVKSVQQAMINHCEMIGGRMAILDTPPGLKPQQAERWRIDETGYDSMFATLYYPWITIANPRAGTDREPSIVTVPPCGHIAGIYARNDTERGVHKAPANEVVRGALSLAADITTGEQAGLNQNGVNCIRSFLGRGIRVWGARTLSRDPAWRYVNVRRLFNMVEKSIERDTQWIVFEPNEPGLWSRVRRDVSAFLMTLWRDGALFGDTPQEAFFVKCDAELNPPESRDLGYLIIEVGLAPVKPAEFVVFRFSQYAGGGQ